MAYEKKIHTSPTIPESPRELIRRFYQLDEQVMFNDMAFIMSLWTAPRMCFSCQGEIDELFINDHSTLSDRGITMLARLTMGVNTPNRLRFLNSDYVQQAIKRVLPSKYAKQVIENKYSATINSEE